MPNLIQFCVELWSDRKGQDFMEYALIAAFITVIAVAVFPAVSSTGLGLNAVIQALSTAIAATASH